MSKRWTIIFKALGNINRIKIIKMLWRGDNLNVTQISEDLVIALKSTPKHLIILQNLDVLESLGKSGHVFYKFNESLPSDLKKSIQLFVD